MCLHPITVRYSNAYTGATGSRSVTVPCGKCPECLRDYQNSWTVRLLHQLSESVYGVFFTFTYSDDSVPLCADPLTGATFPTVDKEGLQSFFKRCRLVFLKSSGKHIKYFITSEYGPRTLRPHYHGILFGVTLNEFKTFFGNPWKLDFGFYDARSLSAASPQSYKSCKYVAKYCSKGMFENPRVKDGFVKPTFHLISKGIGKSYLTNENISYHLALSFDSRSFGFVYSPAYLDLLSKNLKVNVAGFEYKMPRYYKEAIFKKRKFLQSSYQVHVLSRSLLFREQKFGLLQPDGSPNHSAFKVALDTDLRETVQKSHDAITSIARDFDKSKI